MNAGPLFRVSSLVPLERLLQIRQALSEALLAGETPNQFLVRLQAMPTDPTLGAHLVVVCSSTSGG